MWFYLGFQNFVAKKTHNDVSCEIFVSDFTRIWHKSLSNEELLSTSQKLNPLFEAPVQKLKDLTLSLLGDVEVKKEIKQDNDNIVIKVESNVMNIKFHFHVILNQGDNEMFYREFTLPLLLAIVKTQNREKKLIKIIQDKDEEIKDYKHGYGITPNYLTTKPFSKEEFYSQEPEIDSPWDNSFLDCIESKLHVIETKLDDVSYEGKSDRMPVVNERDKKNSIFKDKNLYKNSGSKPCLLLDNKVIKKRKKHNDGFKIRL